MIRALSLAAALAVGLAVPAFAAETADKVGTEAAAGPATQNLFTSDQARQHLMHLGYTNVSELTKDEGGKWVGKATKDGKTLTVAVDIKGPAPVVHASPTAN